MNLVTRAAAQAVLAMRAPELLDERRAALERRKSQAAVVTKASDVRSKQTTSGGCAVGRAPGADDGGAALRTLDAPPAAGTGAAMPPRGVAGGGSIAWDDRPECASVGVDVSGGRAPAAAASSAVDADGSSAVEVGASMVSHAEMESSTVVDLRSWLRNAGLSCRGRRAELVERWRDNYARVAAASDSGAALEGGVGAARKRGSAEAAAGEACAPESGARESEGRRKRMRIDPRQ